VTEAKKKPKVEGGQQRFSCRSFQLKKPAFAVPMQGLKQIISKNTGNAKAASTFNLTIEVISDHVANRLKFDGPLAAFAICELKAPIIVSPPIRPTQPTSSKQLSGRENAIMPTINRNGGMRTPKKSTIL
jgi:hypothetical protein